MQTAAQAGLQTTHGRQRLFVKPWLTSSTTCVPRGVRPEVRRRVSHGLATGRLEGCGGVCPGASGTGGGG